MPHYSLTAGGGAFCFFSFFNFRFSFRLSWAFFCFSLLLLSFFPLSAIFVSPCLKMTFAGLWPSCFTNANPMPIKKPPLTSAVPKASEGKLGWVGYVHHKHTLPAEHLTIECRMVEQKKPPSTGAPAIDRWGAEKRDIEMSESGYSLH